MYYPLTDGGFVGYGEYPRPDNPSNWLIWHFTHVANLPSIAAAQVLKSASDVTPMRNVALSGIKKLREGKLVDPDPEYPTSTVSEHVPFYISAKSPMLYAVCKSHDEYHGGREPLVFLGVRWGEVIDSGLTWCASDGNASAAITRFSRDVKTIGEFVDFRILQERWWQKNSEDLDQPRRRAAEVLVYRQLPLDFVKVVVACEAGTLAQAQEALADVGGARDYHVRQGMYY